MICKTDQIFGNINFFKYQPVFLFVHPCFEIYKVNNSGEHLSHSDRNLKCYGMSPESFSYHVENIIKISADSVHLIHKSNSGNFIMIRLSPYCFGLWFNSSDCAE